MTLGKKIFAAALVACSLSAQAFAQTPGCISLKSSAQVEEEVTDAAGKKSVQLVKADKVVPGAMVIWTVSATNVCKQPSDKVTINNPVPEHMAYVANSAVGVGSQVTYSLDGKTFASPAEITVTENGVKRAATAAEYKHIRWVFANSLQPGASVTASFRAVLN
jgi:uncharacterized repeat protein (TIGR01451 family)